jgi:hypothetical protein
VKAGTAEHKASIWRLQKQQQQQTTALLSHCIQPSANCNIHMLRVQLALQMKQASNQPQPPPSSISSTVHTGSVSHQSYSIHRDTV